MDAAIMPLFRRQRCAYSVDLAPSRIPSLIELNLKNTRPSGPKTGLHSFPALDGVRGVAAILVALFHLRNRFLGFNNFPGGDGYLAVDLFFVLVDLCYRMPIYQDFKTECLHLSL